MTCSGSTVRGWSTSTTSTPTRGWVWVADDPTMGEEALRSVSKDRSAASHSASADVRSRRKLPHLPRQRSVDVPRAGQGLMIGPSGEATSSSDPHVETRRRLVLETLPPRGKELDGRKSRLPAIEVGPAEIPRYRFDDSSWVCHRQSVVHISATGRPMITTRPAAARDRMIGHDGSNSERRMLNFADRGWA
jgi:hypothetical protein